MTGGGERESPESAELEPNVGPAESKSHGHDGGGEFAPGLYITATPIGHAADLTLRARALLGACDLLLAEDTRVTAKLLALHDLSPRMAILNDPGEEAAIPAVLRRLAEGAVVALVSDAGTPLLSDPGYRLVRAAIAEGHTVTTLPGASALLAALSLAALPMERFFFAGFPPPKAAARRRAFAELARIPSTLVFYEAPQRLAESLADMAAMLGMQRPAAVARELTKRHEEVWRGPLGTLAARAAAAQVRGEIVVVVGPPEAPTGPDAAELEDRLRTALAARPLKEAVAEVAAATGLPRRLVYARALALTRPERP